MNPSRIRRRPFRAGVSLLLAAGALTGCAGASGATAEPGGGTVVIRDGALRVPDADCAGSGTFLFAHAGATLSVVDADGEVVVESALDPGSPARTDDKDYGSAKRIPTFCTFDFDAAALIDGDTYTFRIDDTEIGSVEVRRDDDGEVVIAYPPLGVPITGQDDE